MKLYKNRYIHFLQYILDSINFIAQYTRPQCSFMNHFIFNRILVSTYTQKLPKLAFIWFYLWFNYYYWLPPIIKNIYSDDNLAFILSLLFLDLN